MNDRALEGHTYIVGAYAASPAHTVWNPQLEKEFFDALSAIPAVGALELPWLGRLHPHDDNWLLTNLPVRWTAVLTDIGHVMSRVPESEVGLASKSATGRAAALADVDRLRRDARRFNDHAGRRVVSAVELHSSPRAAGSVAAFADSLAEITSWEWDGARIVVEHCDAFIKGQLPEKGFLTLEDEIEAATIAGPTVGISLNWGRSAIELRDPDHVVDHVRTAAASGLLSGLIFSGAADRAGDAGEAWVDAHHAFARSEQHPLGDPTSLLTEDRVAEALTAVAESECAPWLGAKVGWARSEGSAAARAHMIEDALAALRRQREMVSRSRLDHH